MIKYEYLVVKFHLDNRHEEMHELNAWGEAGWDLITIEMTTPKRFYFRRIKDN